VFSKEDEDYYLQRSNGAKLIRLLKFSQLKAGEQPRVSSKYHFLEVNATGEGQVDPLGRFFNSEYWRISSYMSTVIPTFFLSVFVAIIDFAPDDIQYIL